MELSSFHIAERAAPSGESENGVVDGLCRWLANARSVREAIAAADAGAITVAIGAAERAAAMLIPSHGRGALVACLIERVELAGDAVAITLHRPALAARLGAA